MIPAYLILSGFLLQNREDPDDSIRERHSNLTEEYKNEHRKVAVLSTARRPT
jgi:hypothetical protein